MLFDMPLEELRAYKPPCDEPDDFDGFWRETLREARQYPLDASFEPVDYGLVTVETLDVSFNGYGGQPIKGWLLMPRSPRSEPLPCVIEFLGYGGGRGFPTDHLVWSNAGFAHLVMDIRGQGSAWLNGGNGDTPDREPAGTNPQYPGFMTRGVLDPTTYYYRRVFTDGVRAVETALSHEAIDSERIALTGASQGGGITLAVGALVSAAKVVMPDVPFLCHYRRATEITDAAPYNELVKFCQTHRDRVETVFETLSYFDGINFAARTEAQALFSVGLMDLTYPPSTVFAAYNHFAGPKDIRVYHYNRHEGGGNYQVVEKVKFLRTLWG